jgi:hypothetical protein
VDKTSPASDNRSSVQTGTPAASNWVPDGTFSPGEYSGTAVYASGVFELHWSSDGKHIFIGIKVQTTGWVSIGFPSNAMMTGDIIIASVNKDVVTISDHFSVGTSGPHQPDMELGGTQDIIQAGGKEEQGYTVIEFQRLLTTGDAWDVEVTPGAVIIWAYGATDSFTYAHVNRGYGYIPY